jgi:hypothetical protein
VYAILSLLTAGGRKEKPMRLGVVVVVEDYFISFFNAAAQQ